MRGGWACSAAVALCLSACGAGEATPNEALVACTHEPPLGWQSFGQGFMTQNCTPCHHSQLPAEQRNDAPTAVNLDTYEGVLQWADRVAVRSLGADASMPPGGGIGEQDLSLLEEWLGCQVAADKAWLDEAQP